MKKILLLMLAAVIAFILVAFIIRTNNYAFTEDTYKKEIVHGKIDNESYHRDKLANGANIDNLSIINENYGHTDMSGTIYQQSENIDEIEMLLSLNPIKVYAVLQRSTNLYKYYGGKHKIGSMPKGTKVEFHRDKKEKWAYVRSQEGREGWIPYNALSSFDFCSDFIKQDFTDTQKVNFVNTKGYESKTDYLVWVSQHTQKVNVFLGKKANWRLCNTFDCSTGKASTPTLNGIFTVQKRLQRWNFPDYFVKNVLVYYDSYAFHSITYKYNGKVLDPSLSVPASHGCIRLSEKDSLWMYKYIPDKTTVVIH